MVKIMDYNYKVTVKDMMEARDAHALRQTELIKEYESPIISFTLNIPGPFKRSLDYDWVFFEGIREIEDRLNKNNIKIIYKKRYMEKWGNQCLFITDISDDMSLKKITSSIEDSSRLGRIFDIDIIKTNAMKTAREEVGFPGRKCLICENLASLCARSRRHSIDELVSYIDEIIKDEKKRIISELIKDSIESALIEEVQTSPKPGLVDMIDNGAHNDMDPKLFMKSAKAISPYLMKIYDLGFNKGQKRGDLIELFKEIRVVGIEAEKAMFNVTEGVNTHKGAIFTMGIILAATGYSLSMGDLPDIYTILSIGNMMCRDTLLRELEDIKKKPKNKLTNGDKLYIMYGEKGIRGQAIEGFPVIKNIAYPLYRRSIKEKDELLKSLVLIHGEDLRDEFREAIDKENDKDFTNALNINILLYIIMNLNDTNIVNRSSYEMMEIYRDKTKGIIDKGGAFTKSGLEGIKRLNVFSIKENISPGGSADILSLTILLNHIMDIWEGDIYE